MSSKSNKQALILAAGRGERMRPLTDYVPKPLLPIDGKAVILHLLETLHSAGFIEVVVTVGYLGEKIKAFVGENKSPSQKFDFAYQEKLLGSADAIKAAEQNIHGNFLAMAADTVFEAVDIKKMVLAFDEGGCQAVVGLKKVKKEELKERSTADVDENHYLKKVIEKPREGEELSLFSVAPIYFFESETIWRYLKDLQPSPNGIYQLATALQQIIDDGGKIKGVLLRDTKDITRPIDVLKHNFPYLNELL